MNTTHRRPRPFRLVRHAHVTGLCGTGILAEGVEWSDGTVAVRWRGPCPSTSTWDSIDALLAAHGAGGRTLLHWMPTTPLAVAADSPPRDVLEVATAVWLPAPGLDGLCTRCGEPWPCLSCGL